jgi:hypothetical protein
MAQQVRGRSLFVAQLFLSEVDVLVAGPDSVLLSDFDSFGLEPFEAEVWDPERA